MLTLFPTLWAYAVFRAQVRAQVRATSALVQSLSVDSATLAQAASRIARDQAKRRSRKPATPQPDKGYGIAARKRFRLIVNPHRTEQGEKREVVLRIVR